jgi:hypothetical protein
MLPVQMPQKLQTLDNLLAQAEHYAGFCMRNSGKMSPTLFLIGADGPLMFVPASLVDADEKDAFANTARLPPRGRTNSARCAISMVFPACHL